jgi:hypothetical protein
MDEDRDFINYPYEETKYRQNVEEMKQLIPFVKEEMKSCPNNDMSFTIIETVDFYNLKRFFKIKTNSSVSNTKSITQFKETLLTNISNLDSFVVIPPKNSLSVDALSGKGNRILGPKVYDVRGDESTIELSEKEILFFIYDNFNDLILFLEKNQNMKVHCFCLGVNLNFFEMKNNIKKNGFLNRSDVSFYFTNTDDYNKRNGDNNIQLTNLPRAILVDKHNTIKEDKRIKDVINFEVEKDLININEEAKIKKNEDQKKIILILFYWRMRTKEI